MEFEAIREQFRSRLAGFVFGLLLLLGCTAAPPILESGTSSASSTQSGTTEGGASASGESDGGGSQDSEGTAFSETSGEGPASAPPSGRYLAVVLLEIDDEQPLQWEARR